MHNNMHNSDSDNKALLTDLYQLTMAQAYWHAGKATEDACFYMHFRENPFKGGYAVACGMAQLAQLIEGHHFTQDAVDYLASLPAPNGDQLFDPAFLQSLTGLRLTVNIDAVREGTVVFPYEPIVRVIGPIQQCQLIETALLNIVNFQTLIATKAARVCQVATGPVAEFGLRRAQGPNGGNLASRAAVVGGCASTSNTLAGMLYDLPVSGTHAHSWVMAFDSELEAFRAYAQAMPHNCTLLVDTYNTRDGVRNAIIVAHEMEQRGQRLAGIRIDSGDLAWLSIQARAQLDEAGLGYVRIVASNDLDEYAIQSLITEQHARIDLWGVGTKLSTAYDQPSLGGVYKLSATREQGLPGDVPLDKSAPTQAPTTPGTWKPCLKVSEQARKSTLPGILEARRYFNDEGIMVGDMIYNRDTPPRDDLIIDPLSDLRRKDLANASRTQTLLEPLIRGGEVHAPLPSALEARENTRANLAQLHPSNKRFLNPHSYPVGLEQALHTRRDTLIKAVRQLV